MPKTCRIAHLFALAAVTCVALTACGESDGPPATPGEAARRFVIASADGDIDRFMTIMPPMMRPEEQEAQAKFRQGLQQQFDAAKPEDKDVKSVEILDQKINGDSAVVKLKINLANGKEELLEMPFMKLDGAWYADLMFGSLGRTPR